HLEIERVRAELEWQMRAGRTADDEQRGQRCRRERLHRLADTVYVARVCREPPIDRRRGERARMPGVERSGNDCQAERRGVRRSGEIAQPRELNQHILETPVYRALDGVVEYLQGLRRPGVYERIGRVQAVTRRCASLELERGKSEERLVFAIRIAAVE